MNVHVESRFPGSPGASFVVQFGGDLSPRLSVDDARRLVLRLGVALDEHDRQKRLAKAREAQRV